VSSCDSSQFLSQTPTPKCLNCDASCLTCSDSSSSSCLSCTGTLFLDSSTHTCTPSCPSHSFANASSHECTDCSSDCATCSGAANSQCLSCTLPNYFQVSTHSCMTTCNQGQYAATLPSPECLSCDSSCSTCSGTLSSDCLSCTGSLFLNDATKVCSLTCPDGYYKNVSDNKCTACDKSCLTCTGKTDSECLSCKGSFAL